MSRLLITLQPSVLQWARERARLDVDVLARKVGVRPERVAEWEASGAITIAQADKVAHHTHTPVGFLYLDEPPEDRLPISDFRSRSDDALQRPSPDLLETVYLMQRRQAWMHDDLVEEESDPLEFVGAHGLDSPAERIATAMRDALEFRDGWAAAEGTWSDALRRLRDRIENTGVLVVFNGIVGNNTRRKLDPDEFQGFALVDEYAPLVFVNSADFKAAQIFTLAHELAHIFIGADGVSRFEALQPTANETENLCNSAAADFLVPDAELRDSWSIARRARDPYQAIARQFKVSSLVAARRALDTELISREMFFEFYSDYKDNELRGFRRGEHSGGNFWSTQRWRIGPRFGMAVARAVKEGRLPYREAYGLTGIRGETFERMPEKIGLPL